MQAFILFFYHLDTFPPVILEATVQELPDGMGQLYECEAVGLPLPVFIWSALNLNTGIRERLQNNITGITINEEEELVEVKGLLLISSNADFDNPRCVAENELGRARENIFVLEFGATVIMRKLNGTCPSMFSI